MTSVENQSAIPLETLTERKDFIAMSKTGRKWVTKGFVVQADPVGENNDAPIKVGYTVTKKVGNAVVRNRCKRRLREIARQVIATSGTPGWRYVLIGRDDTPDYPYSQLINDLKWAIRKLSAGADLKPRSKRTQDKN